MKNYFSAWILCGIIVAVFLLQSAFPYLTDEYALSGLGNPITLLTSLFLHGSISHLLGNLFALGLFGILLEQEIGTKKFLAVYFASGIIAGLVGVFFYSSLIGASGAISGVLGMLAILRPRMLVWTYGVPMPMIFAAFFWLVLDIGGAFYPSTIANISHIAGLIFGAAIGLAIRKPEPKGQKKQRLLSRGDLDKWEDDWM
jgi:membrane associated rhomboid family serine protease